MSVLTSDVKYYKASTNDDSTSNGGRISSTQISDNTSNNIFPNVTSAERASGKTRYRKFFIRNEESANLTLQNFNLWIGSKSTAAGNYYQLKAGTDTDTQAEADDYTNWAAAGTLAVAAGSGDSSIQVDYESASGVFDTAVLHIDDGTNEATVTVDGSPSWSGTKATLTISGDLGNNFAQTTTVVSTKIDLSDIEASSNSWTETSSLGTYDESTYPLTTYNVGSVTDSFTLTFSSSTEFSCAGANTGSIGSGDTSTDFQPSNGASYYIKIDKDGWGGTWANGDTVTFNTVHSGKSIWAKEVTAAGAASASNNTMRIDWTGESA